MENKLEFRETKPLELRFEVLNIDTDEIVGYIQKYFIKGGKLPWLFEANNSYKTDAFELRQIADKLDELNGVDAKSICKNSLTAFDKILKEMPKEELDAIIARVHARMGIH